MAGSGAAVLKRGGVASDGAEPWRGPIERGIGLIGSTRRGSGSLDTGSCARAPLATATDCLASLSASTGFHSCKSAPIESAVTGRVLSCEFSAMAVRALLTAVLGAVGIASLCRGVVGTDEAEFLFPALDALMSRVEKLGKGPDGISSESRPASQVSSSFLSSYLVIGSSMGLSNILAMGRGESNTLLVGLLPPHSTLGMLRMS